MITCVGRWVQWLLACRKMTKFYQSESERLHTHPDIMRKVWRLFVCTHAVGNFDVSKARLCIDGVSANPTGWPRVYMGKIAHENRRRDLAHECGF